MRILTAWVRRFSRFNQFRTRRLLAGACVSMLAIAMCSVLGASASVTHVANPDLQPVCGIDVSIVIDRSGSISANNDEVAGAGQALVGALVGTGSRVQVVSFGTTARAEPGGGSNLADLAFSDPATLTIPVFPSSGSTNWDDALEMVRRSPAGIAPLTVIVTDGDPTRRNLTQPDGHGGVLAGDGSTTSQADLDAAVTEADLIRGSGHILAVGVGSALSNAASVQRLKDISGTDQLIFDGAGNPNIPFGTADYTLVTDFDNLKATFAHFARELCGPSLNVVKKLQLANGQTVVAGAADPFGVVATVSPTPGSWQSPSPHSGASATVTTNADGEAHFKWEPAVASTTSAVTVNENQRSGWVFNGAKCWRNHLDGSPLSLIVDDVGANAVGASKAGGWGIPGGIGPDQLVNCELYNRQLRTSTIAVDKVTSPAGRPEGFTFQLFGNESLLDTVSGVTDAGAPAAFDPVLPNTYLVAEVPVAHFTPTASSCDNLGTDAVETVSPGQLAVGEQQSWKCTFTNTAENGTITVVKHVAGALGGSFGFTSSIPGHQAFTLTPANGADASASFSVAPLPSGTYAVDEPDPSPFSATSKTCDDGSPVGAISVSPAEHVTCTFTNTAPLPTISVTKTPAVASVPEPGGPVVFTAAITNTSVAPLTLTELKDVVGDETIDLLTQGTVAPACGAFDDAPIGVGDTLTCTFTRPVTGNAGDVVTDVVTAKAADAYEHVATGTASASVSISDVNPTITVTKIADKETVPEPGGAVTYTVTVTNTSPEPVTLTSITDSVSGGLPFAVCTLAAIPAGLVHACSFTQQVTGNAGDLVGDVIVVNGHDDDGNPVTGQATESVSITDVAPAASLDKSANPDSVDESGGPVTFTVTIHNDSPEPLRITALRDVVADGIPFDITTATTQVTATTCDDAIGHLIAVDGDYTCTFTLVVSGDTGDSVDDTVSATLVDDDDGSVVATDSTSVDVTDVLPSITVTKTNDPNAIDAPGGPVTFTVTMTNTSPEPVTVSSITDQVGSAAPVDVTTVGGAVTATTCEVLGTFAAEGQAGSAMVCTFDMQVASNSPTVVNDVVRVTAHDNDGNDVTGSSPASTVVRAVADLGVTKKTDAPLIAGSNGSYSVTVTNHGPSAAADVVLTDDVPEGLTAISATGSGWQCSTTGAGHLVICRRDAMAATELSTVTVNVDVTAAAAGTTVTNRATVASSTKDDDPSNNSTSVTDDVPQVLGLVIERPRSFLARTGASVVRLTMLGIGMIALGLALWALRRRRTT